MFSEKLKQALLDAGQEVSSTEEGNEIVLTVNHEKHHKAKIFIDEYAPDEWGNVSYSFHPSDDDSVEETGSFKVTETNEECCVAFIVSQVKYWA